VILPLLNDISLSSRPHPEHYRNLREDTGIRGHLAMNTIIYSNSIYSLLFISNHTLYIIASDHTHYTAVIYSTNDYRRVKRKVGAGILQLLVSLNKTSTLINTNQFQHIQMKIWMNKLR
jgi:hypothetical protein